jgi:hypothetical protein
LYKIEILVLFEKSKTKCKTASSIKNLIQSDSEISISGNKINFNKNEYAINIRTGKDGDKAHAFFVLTVRCNSEALLDDYSSLIRSIKSSLYLVSKDVHITWDDLILYYSVRAYPILYRIENAMRLLITKFMLTNVGLGWTKDRVPVEVKESIKKENDDTNYLNNVDFIQLANFLFSENFPKHKEDTIQKLKGAKDLSALNIEEVKALLPESNWNKFFEPLVGCEGEYLKKRWKKLYDLRCKVAHNKTFNKNDLAEVKSLTQELEPILEKAISSLDKISIPETEKDEVVESAVSSYGLSYKKYMARFNMMILLLRQIDEQVSSERNSRIGGGNRADLLHRKGIIDSRQRHVIKNAYLIRNMLAHNEITISERDIITNQEELEYLTMALKDVAKNI